MKATAAWARTGLVAFLTAMTAACASGRGAGGTPHPNGEAVADGNAAAPAAAAASDRLAEAMERARAAVPAQPDLAQPTSMEGTRVWRTAVLGKGLRVLVSTEARALWLMRDTVVLMRAPVAVGMQEGFVYKGKRYDFKTPIGQRRVLEKGDEPIWVPPDWHYFEIALEHGLEPVQLRSGQKVALGDGSTLEVRAREVGRINQFGNFYAFEPGNEIIFDGKVFIPPFGTRQRQIPDVLGTHKLGMGDGYLIHGTNQETSIGDAVSHGCIRMYNEDVAQLFDMVPVGTPVYIF